MMTSTNHYTYMVPQVCKESKYKMSCTWHRSAPCSVVEYAAEDFYDNHDGWGYGWPLDFEVFCNDESLGVFTVKQKARPVFHAEEKE